MTKLTVTKSKPEIYIGIDFSLKSPAICMFNDNKYKWLSHCSKVLKPKKDIKTQEDVAALGDVWMEYQRSLETGTDYTTRHWADLQNYRNHAQEMVSMIMAELKGIDFDAYTFRFGFEGYSFNSFSSSNNIIDIVSATTTFKNMLIDQFLGLDFTIDIVAPISLKQMACYSKVDKVDLFDIFTGLGYDYIREKYADAIQKDYDKKVAKGKPSVFNWDFQDEYLSGEFYDFCRNYEINRAVKKPKVPKPIDDMIDAYFVCCWLRAKFYAAEGQRS